MPQQAQKTGFTLVELLVVIGIIALLISILLPALSKARVAANSVACMSNLRQVGIGVLSYAGENTGRLPAGSWANWTPGDAAYWYTLINPYVGGKGETSLTAGLGTSSNTLSKAFLCAAAPVQSGYIHYTSNPVMMGRDSEAKPSGSYPGYMPALKITGLGRTAELVLALDGVQNSSNGNVSAVAFMMDGGIPFWAMWGTGGISASQRFRLIPLEDNREGTAIPPLGRQRWRHSLDNRVINVVYADGHADSHQVGELTENNMFPTGWKATKK